MLQRYYFSHYQLKLAPIIKSKWRVAGFEYLRVNLLLPRKRVCMTELNVHCLNLSVKSREAPSADHGLHRA